VRSLSLPIDRKSPPSDCLLARRADAMDALASSREVTQSIEDTSLLEIGPETVDSAMPVEEDMLDFENSLVDPRNDKSQNIDRAPLLVSNKRRGVCIYHVIAASSQSLLYILVPVVDRQYRSSSPLQNGDSDVE